MNNKNNVATFFVYFVIFCFIFLVSLWDSGLLDDVEINLSPNDYARITDIDYQGVLFDNPSVGSSLFVTERITFDIHAASKSNPFWELWRDLPEDNSEGVPVKYDVISVKQIMDDGSEIIYDESPQLYWEDEDYISSTLGPKKWYHSKGPYNEYTRDYECIFFYIDGIYREEVTFEIQYIMSNPAMRYLDCSELYLSFYDDKSIKYLESFNAEIWIEDTDMPSEGNYIATTFGTKNDTFEFTENSTDVPGYHIFTISLDESELDFKPYNSYLEFDLVSTGEDRHIFTEYAPDNLYSQDYVLDELDDEREYYLNLSEVYHGRKILVFTIVFLIAAFSVWRTFTTDTRFRSQYTFYEPEIPFDYFREIPSNQDPLFAANLAFCKEPKQKELKDGYSALMLSLVRKGYIELSKIDSNKDWTSTNTLINVKYKPLQEDLVNDLLNTDSISASQTQTSTLEPLTYNEELYFNLIVRHSKGAPLILRYFQTKILADYQNTETFVDSVENSTVNIGISQGYFQKANYNQLNDKIRKASSSYMIWGVLITIIPNLILFHTHLDLAFGAFFVLGISFIINSKYLKKLSKKYTLLTQFGETEYAKWNGLYRFLNSETLMKDRTIIELPLWEQYLVYATAFGISQKVIKALKIRCPEIQNSPMLSNTYYRSNSFYTSNRSFRSTTHSAAHYSRSMSNGSWSYGGGGRGGGGGRRRSLIFHLILI